MTLRRPPFAGTLILATGLALARPGGAAAQQPDWDSVEVQTIPVADGIYMLKGRGGNMGLSVGSDGTLLIDDEFAPLSDKIKAAVRAAGGGKVEFLLNTHWHGDHTGGNEAFGASGSMIVAHQNVRRRLDPAHFRKIVGERSQQLSDEGLPIITFTDTLRFYWNDDEIQIVHVPPAHTDGDSFVHFVKADVIHTGDLYFNGGYPVIDVGAGGGIDGMIHALDKLLAVADSNTRFIPGHGELSGPDGVRAFRDMLTVVRDRVRMMINDGKTEDEVVAARPTADLDDEWDAFVGPERFVRTVYQSLARDR